MTLTSIFSKTVKMEVTLWNHWNNTLHDYIAPYIKIVKMEVTLTSIFPTYVASSVVYIFLQAGIE